MNSTTPKRHAETLRNRNISFQLKKRNTYRNGIDNLDFTFNALNFVLIMSPYLTPLFIFHLFFLSPV